VAASAPEDLLTAARRLATVATVAGLAAAGLASARADPVILPPPGTGAWRPLAFRSVGRMTAYAAVSIDGVDAMRADSNCAASALWLALDDIDLGRTPHLSWRWKVEQGLEVPDERIAAGDDFAARVYVLFRLDAARATLGQRLRHRLGRLLYRREPPGSALNFVWASHSEIGAVWDNPFADTSKMVVVATGRSPGWRQEEVDLGARYRALFASAPPPLLGLAVMSDTDNTCQKATAWFADFRFRGGGR
jgi:hypothetical protein